MGTHALDHPTCIPYTFLRVWKGTDVLIHVALPARMPTDNLTVGVPRFGMVAEVHADTHAPCAYSLKDMLSFCQYSVISAQCA